MPAKFQPLPPLSVLHHHFQIAPVNTLGVDSGLIWLVPTAANCRPGDIAGGLSTHSKQTDRQDWKLCFNYTKYYISRIVYALHHNIDPANQTIDHLDRNSLNNSVSNLQLVDRVIQNRNRRLFKNNTSGIRGVSWSVSGKGWTAQIGHDGTVKQLGCFSCKVKAANAYNNALEMLCPDRFSNLKHDLSSILCNCSSCTLINLWP